MLFNDGLRDESVNTLFHAARPVMIILVQNEPILMDPSKKSDYTKLLLSLVPESGVNVGNVTLRNELCGAVKQSFGDEISEQDYWLLRDSLIDEGLIAQGRGKGGSVHRVVSSEPATVEVPATEAEALIVVPPKAGEAALYDPFHKAILEGYVKENRIRRFISQETASQGRRGTGGKWTRPDLTLIAVRTYQFTPGKRLEVITFEIKPNLDSAVEGLFEALAHSVFAHRSYLAVNLAAFKEDEDIPDERIVQESNRLGVGYITFTDPADYDTYEIVTSARLSEPDPYEIDNFIRTQISPEKQEELRELF